MIRWHGFALAGIVVIMMAAVAAQSAPADTTRADGRVEQRTGPSTGGADVRVWINGQEVAAADPAAAERRSERSDAGRPAYLGVIAAPLTDRAKDTAKVEAGVLVSQVLPGSPAARLDLRPDDVITSVGDTPIASPQQLADCVRQHRPGEKVSVTWLRDGKRMQEAATLAAMPGERPIEPRPEGRQPEGRGEPAAGDAYLGIVGGPMTGEMAEIAGINRGVVVKGLTDGSPAAKAGLQAGDVITSIDGRDVNDPRALIEIVRGHKPGDALRAEFYRMGKRLTATVTVGERTGGAGRSREGAQPGAAPEEMPGMSPDMRKYMESMRPQIEEWLKQFQGQGVGGPRSARPTVPPGGATEPYDVGKDMGRILERLERMDRRLGEIERRLDQLEKK